MHGRPREYKNFLHQDPKAAEAYKKKVDTIRAATAAVLECCKQNRYDEAAMSAAAKLLKVVPEIYTVWNYRRRALGAVLEAGGEPAINATEGELALTLAALSDNPKSYSAWHHRKWVVLKGHANLNRELALVTRALSEDQRNFHAWNYRQFVVKLLQRTPEEELAYSEEKIIENFSNYSAFHYRSVVLPKVHASQAAIPFEELLKESPAAAAARADESSMSSLLGTASQRKPLSLQALDEEYDMVHQAFATDSDDQSPWFYYRWLMGNSLAHLDQARGTPQEAEAQDALKQVLEREVERFERDHLSMVPDAKWPLLTVARLKEAQARMHLADGREDALVEEVRSIYQRLMVIDPMRKGYYLDALEGKAFVVVQALGTV